jgi:hypothetical protein
MSKKQFKNTFRVGFYKCEMTYSKEDGLKAEWEPDLPNHNLSTQELEQYRSGRDALLNEVGKYLGGSVLVIEE